MNARLSSSFLAILIVVFGGISLLFSAGAQQEYHRLAVAHEEYTRASSRAAALGSKLRALNEERHLPAPSAHKASVKQERTSSEWHAVDFDKTLGQHADLQNLRMDVTRSLIRTRYQPLFNALKLSDEQIAIFAENTANSIERFSDTTLVLASRHIDGKSEEAGKLYSNVVSETESAQKKLLGEPGFAAWKEYERSVFIRQMVADSAAAATLRGWPLSSTQLEELHQAYSGSSTSYQSGSYVSPNDINWRSVDEKVSLFLSPAQQKAIFQTLNGGRSLWQLQAAVQKADQADREAAKAVASK